MNWLRWLRWSGIRFLMVALAIMGSGLDAVSVPILAAAGFGASTPEELDATDSEGERDEAPDDLNDLTDLLGPMASRGEKRRHHEVPLPDRLRGSWLGSQGTSVLQTSPRSTKTPAFVRLCRFNC